MRILCIGGGPAGLYLALLMKKADPRHAIRVVERNRPYDTFGWGVVFSDQTMGNLRGGRSRDGRARSAARSTTGTTSTSTSRAATITSGGHGFCGIGRKRLLNILQERCEELGVELVFETDVDRRRRRGARVRRRPRHRRRRHQQPHPRRAIVDAFAPDVDVRRCRFVWLGTKQLFDAFTFAFVETEHGWFQAHAYQFDGDTSTFIVETPEDVWQTRRARAR